MGTILAIYRWNEPYAVVQFNSEKPECIPCRELIVVPELSKTEFKIRNFLFENYKLFLPDHEIRIITEKMKAIFNGDKNEI
jgi:hypothetical protein